MPNRLSQETSPYLLQHANNPVDWYPWGEEALTRAKSENKLILVSIGYAACHWCHVMEKESFEDEEVAALMNQHFVCVKVDREERPDIDKTYMDAVMVMTQQGGWPLNAVALPDGRPIWGGTYFPKANWMDALQQIAQMFHENKERTLAYAQDLERAIKDMSKIGKVEGAVAVSKPDISGVLEIWTGQLDFKWGGREASRNKFPLPANIKALIRAAHYTGKEKAARSAEITLEKMAFGGIYDQLGGGFARYSVDQYWKVPHFEKMLYDNGQLISLYAEAYQWNPKPLYKQVVEQTLEFISRELTHENGAFYSSLDADSEGVEGKFYVWTYEEVEAVLGEETKLFADYYNVHPFGNWEGNNVLFVLETEEEFAHRWRLEEADFKRKMADGRAKLMAVRNQRIRPGLDDKILTSWNALMLKGYVDAYKVFQNESYLQTALKNAHFLKDTMSEEDGQLFRNYKEGKRNIPGFLDDYAHVIDAYLSLYQLTFDEQWLFLADKHMEYAQTHFFVEENGMFAYTSDLEEAIVARKFERQDDVIPASNSTMAHALESLGLLLHKPAYRQQARQMLDNMQREVFKSPAWHAGWFTLMLRQVFPQFEVAITGTKAADLRDEMAKNFLPQTLFVGAASESKLEILANRFTDKSMIYVCQDMACKLPVEEVEDALGQMG